MQVQSEAQAQRYAACTERSEEEDSVSTKEPGRQNAKSYSMQPLSMALASPFFTNDLDYVFDLTPSFLRRQGASAHRHLTVAPFASPGAIARRSGLKPEGDWLVIGC